MLSFSGHETFPFRLGWLSKGVRTVMSRPSVFSDEDAIVVLGVGKNMVRSIRYWCLAFDLIEESGRGTYAATILGKRLFDPLVGVDPYLEDAATLWWLHWKLVRNQSRATTWYYTFNELTNRSEFTKASLGQSILQWVVRLNERLPSTSSLDRDIDCMLHTYWMPRRQLKEDSLACPLTELNLIHNASDRYRLNRGSQPTLPDTVFAAALSEFISDSQHSQRRSLPVEQFLYHPGSPGRAFLLTENSSVDRLEKLASLTDGALSYTATAGLRQVLIHRIHKDPIELLMKHYGRHPDALSASV